MEITKQMILSKIKKLLEERIPIKTELPHFGFSYSHTPDKIAIDKINVLRSIEVLNKRKKLFGMFLKSPEKPPKLKIQILIFDHILDFREIEMSKKDKEEIYQFLLLAYQKQEEQKLINYLKS